MHSWSCQTWLLQTSLCVVLVGCVASLRPALDAQSCGRKPIHQVSVLIAARSGCPGRVLECRHACAYTLVLCYASTSDRQQWMLSTGIDKVCWRSCMLCSRSTVAFVNIALRSRTRMFDTSATKLPCVMITVIGSADVRCEFPRTGVRLVGQRAGSKKGRAV